MTALAVFITLLLVGAICVTAAEIIVYLTARERRARRRAAHAAFAEDPAPVGDDTVSLFCRPCNGEPGLCTCAGLCGHPDCVGDHTVLRDMAAELEAMLSAADGSGELGRPE